MPLSITFASCKQNVLIFKVLYTIFETKTVETFERNALSPADIAPNDQELTTREKEEKNIRRVALSVARKG